jgi:hypothetical protein
MSLPTLVLSMRPAVLPMGPFAIRWLQLTHIEHNGSCGVIECHLARANPHCIDLAEGGEALMIFQDPKATSRPTGIKRVAVFTRHDVRVGSKPDISPAFTSRPLRPQWLTSLAKRAFVGFVPQPDVTGGSSRRP